MVVKQTLQSKPEATKTYDALKAVVSLPGNKPEAAQPILTYYSCIGVLKTLLILSETAEVLSVLYSEKSLPTLSQLKGSLTLVLFSITCRHKFGVHQSSVLEGVTIWQIITICIYTNTVDHQPETKDETKDSRVSFLVYH